MTQPLILEVPPNVGQALTRARVKLEHARNALDGAYGTASEADFIAILKTLGDAYAEVARLEREALQTSKAI